MIIEVVKLIQIFDIKKAHKNLINNDTSSLKEYQDISLMDVDKVIDMCKGSFSGLSSKDATSRLNDAGANVVVREDNKSWLYFMVNAFRDNFIIVLLVLAGINFYLKDVLGSFIIVLIACISATIRFVQEYSTYKFNKKLKKQITGSTMVIRDGSDKLIPVCDVVLGDVVKLNAGSVIPADVRIIESRDLFVNQAVFTGESIPVEKFSVSHDAKKTLFDLDNICLMGASVISGSATGIVIKTGFDTYLGKIGKEVDVKPRETSFSIGMKNITNLLIKYMVVVCLVVLVIDGLIKGDFNNALLFALSVAVGITPSMLPMIVNVNLTKGSKNLAKKKTLVKMSEAIENLGAIDILCTDKTGTLTEDCITVQKYIDAYGEENDNILEYAYLNSFYATGVKNLVDRAIISYADEHLIDERVQGYVKVDEIPFDYDRRKMSVIVSRDNEYRMITKGALEEIIKICTKVRKNGIDRRITDKMVEVITTRARELAGEGMQVIALCEKREYPGASRFDSSFECDMTFIGFVAFLDPPKKGVDIVLKKLKSIGVSTKILTGDNQYAARNICELVGLDGNNVLIGSDIDKMSSDELLIKIEQVSVFARLNPLQKERVVEAFKKNGHVVGYMGDGVNDAPSLQKADVGISVNTATDIAREASSIILLEKDLQVIYDGVIEGRRVYGNIIKYMKMALSADFGDVFSIMIASIFLPFLPLLPIQMLIQDFIYDFSQIGIPYDNVDMEFLKSPHKWNTKGISKFMKIMGITSSFIDVLSFIIFFYILGYNSVSKQSYFQTAWFVTCLITELLIIYNVRTSKNPFTSFDASKVLVGLTLFSGALTLITPIILSGVSEFNFEILPFSYYFYLLILIALYFGIVTVIKKIYIKKNHEWL